MKPEQRKIHLMTLMSSVLTALMLVIISPTNVLAATHCHSIGSDSYMIGDKNTLGNYCQYNNKTGRLSTETPYAHGVKHGTMRIYYENGDKKQEIPYWNGKKNGTSISWYRNGNYKSKLNFEDGKQRGEYRTWYESGKPSACWFYPHHGKRYKCPL